MDKTKIGIIGCGNISDVYIKNCKSLFDNLEVVACADIDMDRARAKAETYGIPRACSVKELLSDLEIEIVLNLTIHNVHAEVSLAALGAGKHVYSEKPVATSQEDGRKILETAGQKGLLVGCAPDTFLGGGIQTCRKLIEDGAIGEPIGANAFFISRGPDHWHPNPEIFYKAGAGPLFDMGPYYITTLVTLIGKVKKVTGVGKITFPERTITSAPKNGTKFYPGIPTYIVGLMEFENGAIGNLTTTFDICASQLPKMEIYGTQGTLMVPDPNTFDGPVFIKKRESQEWEQVPLVNFLTENCRGLGLSDMAKVIREGGVHRANGNLAYHVLEVMSKIQKSASSGSSCEILSGFETMHL